MPAAAIRAYRTVGAVAILAAIGYEQVHGLGEGGWSSTDYFSYFTNLSNLFAAGVLLAGALRGDGPRSPTFELLRGAAVMYMLTTGIVYAVLLSGHVRIPWTNTIVHQVMPIVVALDWAIDPPRTRLELRETLRWLSFPVLYIAYTLVRGAIVDWYPYFFVNPDHPHGYLRVAVGCLAIGAGMIGLIVAITWVGNRRAVAIERIGPALRPSREG
jgi:hypothetical protein